MTSFIDGPCKGQSMLIKRSPLYMRVTMRNHLGKVQIDALDQLNDTPMPSEVCFAYRIAPDEEQMSFGSVHIKCSGSAKSASGFYKVVSYAFVKEQPAQDVMRNNELWRNWCNKMMEAEKITA
jgi:hypothetical protein